LVLHDMLGLYPDPPKFAKTYANLANDATNALRAYAGEVRSRAFPPRRST
jgi:3-methyl-2-oxobutanoate hydroxymethyltransferase